MKSKRGWMQKCKNGKVLILGGLLLILSGCNNLIKPQGKVNGDTESVEQNTLENGFINTVKIDSGIEVRTDIDGDGKNERVLVQDIVSGNNAFTQLQVNFLNGDKKFTDYPGYYSSFLVVGDLNKDRTAEIILVRYVTGSNFGGCEISVLGYGKEGLEEYPNVILNMEMAKKSGYYIDEENWISLCLGATIVEKENQILLRLIAAEDLDNEVVRCIDCSWQEDGWYIEDVQVVTQYYTKDMERELLKNNFVWD